MKNNNKIFSDIDWKIFFGSTGIFVGACSIGFIISVVSIQNLF